jgi:hypothetical protein
MANRSCSVFNLFWRPYVSGFRVRPPDDITGFNIDQNGLPRRGSAWSDAMLPDTVMQRYPDAAQTTEIPYGMSGPTAGPGGLVQSAPSIGLAGFRVSAQDNVPGFNFRPTDDVPDLDLDDAAEEQEYRRRTQKRQSSLLRRSFPTGSTRS